jgi:hypothetical protein
MVPLEDVNLPEPPEFPVPPDLTNGPPFAWPEEYIASVPPDARATGVWRVPGTAPDSPTGSAYAFIASSGNAIGTQHHNAGIIAGGPRAGDRLWGAHSMSGDFLRAIIAGTI